MKIKAFVLAGVIGLSAQASHAATDTSCNPFLFGGCGVSAPTVASHASANSMVGQLFAALSAQRTLSAQAPAPRQTAQARSRGMGRFMKLFKMNRVSFSRPNGNVFEQETIEVAVTVDEGQSGEGVSVVPVPAAGFLLLAGLGGLAMMRRKKS